MVLPQEKHYTAADYYNTPDKEHVELINGHFHAMAAPGRLHQRLSVKLCSLIDNYITENNGDCHVYHSPFAVQLESEHDTVVEPDISVICDMDKLNDKGCKGAPDWIIEIVSPSNYRHDYVTKLALYAEAGVREYWIIDLQQKRVLVYHFEVDTVVNIYTFNDSVKVGIYEDLSIDFASLSQYLIR